MDKRYLTEKWKPIKFGDTISEKEVYAISTLGRLKSFKINKVVGRLKKPSAIAGYKSIHIVQKSGRKTARYVHKLVAEAFLKKTNDNQIFVIHLDYNKKNNKLENLAWASKEERTLHHSKNPRYKKSSRNSKLTVKRVKELKTILLDPEREITMKLLAKKYKVSEMQLHRIKTGENWGHVLVD